MKEKRHLIVVAALLALSCLVQAIYIARASTPALDSVRWIRIAQAIDDQGLPTALRSEWEQPLYPVAVWAVHHAIRSTWGDFRSAWALSAQLAAAIPLVLTVIPVYFLALRLVGIAAAMIGTTLFCFLPKIVSLGAEGISDSLHLFFFSLACWAIVVSWKSNHLQKPMRTTFRPLFLLPAGIAVGCAALTRVEVLVLGLAFILAIFTFQLRSDWRQTWSRILVGIGYFACGFVLVFGPYLATLDALSPRSAIGRLLGSKPSHCERVLQVDAPTKATSSQYLDVLLPDGKSMAFDIKEPSHSIRQRGYRAAFLLLMGKLAQVFGYIVGLVVLWGVWLLRSRPLRPVDRFLHIYIGLLLFVVLYFTANEGYLSARHLATLVAVAIGCGGYAALDLVDRLNNFMSTRLTYRDTKWIFSSVSSHPQRAIIGVLVVLGLVLAFKPLHTSRQAQRAAAEWLAHESKTPGAVLDTKGWTRLYSGRSTYDYRQAHRAFADPQLAYIVLGSEELRYSSNRSRTLQHLLQQAAEPVATFTTSTPRQAVVVYRWYSERIKIANIKRPIAKKTIKGPDRRKVSELDERANKLVGRYSSRVVSVARPHF